MYTLFISTYDKLITIGLLKNGYVIEKKEIISKQNHSILVMPTIEEILKDNELETSYLNEIIVVNGPGSFTGVRIGVVIAKTLAYTLDIPIKTITSLECIAISNNKKTNKLSTIKDTKGAYIGYFDKNNLMLDDFKYLKNEEYKDSILNKEEYLIECDTFDLEKIYNYLKNKESINPHLVNPIYIKGIDALNDK